MDNGLPDGLHRKVKLSELLFGPGHMLLIAWFALLLAIAVATMLFGVYVLTGRTDKPWNPLGPFPTQQVLKPGNLIDNFPSIHVGQDVIVRGVKCNHTNKPVRAEAELRWQELDPPGAVYVVSHGVAVHKPGCVQTIYANPMPPEVVDRTKALLNAGRQSVTWAITGSNTPVRPDGTRGVTIDYTTNNFEVTR